MNEDQFSAKEDWYRAQAEQASRGRALRAQMAKATRAASAHATPAPSSPPLPSQPASAASLVRFMTPEEVQQEAARAAIQRKAHIQSLWSRALARDKTQP